jgi:hypothetical protein
LLILTAERQAQAKSMEEITAVDILIENLRKRGLNPEIHRTERNFIQPGSDRLWHKKSVIARFGSVFFYAFDSFGTSSFSSNTYTGVYTEINHNQNIDCIMSKKEWIHKLLVRNRQKTGVKHIDDFLTVTSLSEFNPSNILAFSDVLLFLEINKTINPLKIIIEKGYPPSITTLNKKLTVGLETDYWIYKNDELDLFLNQGVNLINNIKVASA